MSHDVILGSGAHRYRLRCDWARLPDGPPFGIVCSVAVDAQDRLIVYARGPRPVTVFGADGTYLGSWGEDTLQDAHGIHVGPDGAVYLTDRDAHEVLKCAPDGSVLMRLGRRGEPSWQAPFNHPTGIAVAVDGEIYVSDGYANARVHRFAADGTFLGGWGRPGSGPGEFRTPHDVCLTSDDRVFVCDRDNHRVQLFDRDGTFLEAWTDHFRPTSVAEDREGFLYVTDLISRLTVYRPDGAIETRMRVSMDGGHSVCVDRNGHVYVAEIHVGRVDKYERLTPQSMA